MRTPHPYNEVRISRGRIIREFKSDSDDHDLIWHQDRLDRIVRVINAEGWKLQLEEGLPFELRDGATYKIPARSWHRVIKGHGDLMIEITEFKSGGIISKKER